VVKLLGLICITSLVYAQLALMTSFGLGEGGGKKLTNLSGKVPFG
jgi:hypothetical protein